MSAKSGKPRVRGARVENLMIRCAKIQFQQGDVNLALNTIRQVAEQTKRPGTRMLAAKFILDHQKDLYKHENPQKQKLEVEFPTELRIKGVAPGSVKKKPTKVGS